MNLFTYVMYSGGELSEDRNFETFGNAMLLLFQCLTGDGWSALMDDLLINEERGCDPSITPTDCGSPLATPFFISFTVIGSFVFLNLVVAVILENFTALGSIDPAQVSAGDISDFKEVWAQFDPDADGLIPARDLPALLTILKPPLGLMGTPEGRSMGKAVRFCMRLSLKQTNGEVGFKETLDALINRNYVVHARAMGVSLEGATNLPALKEILSVRDKAMTGAVDLSRLDGAELKVAWTPRSYETARTLANELMKIWVRRKRREWEDDPMAHPSLRAEQRRNEAAAAEAAANIAAQAEAAARAKAKAKAKARAKAAKKREAEDRGSMPHRKSSPSSRSATSGASASTRKGCAAAASQGRPVPAPASGRALPKPSMLPPPRGVPQCKF